MDGGISDFLLQGQQVDVGTADPVTERRQQMDVGTADRISGGLVNEG